MVKNVTIRIYGRVQGVSFRYYTLQQARLHHISGYVKNEPDGSVLIEAQAEEETLSCFIQWCHDGPRWAIIDKIDVTEGIIKHLQHFTIR